MSLSTYFVFTFFFFKQKTAYERRISDWSSDVCSSDLAVVHAPHDPRVQMSTSWTMPTGSDEGESAPSPDEFLQGATAPGKSRLLIVEIGRASCRDSVCQYV